MADVRPFKAYRPTPGYEELIASLPYDVYSRQEAYDLTRQDEHSFLRIDRPETQFDSDCDMYAAEVYERGAKLLYDQIRAGEFIRDEKDSYYIYEQTFEGRSQTGIVGLASVDDYLNNVIKKHENTRADKEADRIRHVDVLNAHTGPIFLAYRKNTSIEEIINKTKNTDPLYDFVKYDVRQRVWVISDDKDIKQISDAFKENGNIYIADGHHRCASAVKVALKRRSENRSGEASEHFLAVFFPDNELKILDYNRVIKDLNGLSTKEFLERLNSIFEIREAESGYKPASKGEFGLYIDEKWYSLKYPDSRLTGDPVKDLDVAVLQDNVLSPILNITDPKTDSRIDFVGGIRGIKELERRVHTDCVCAFLMYPTGIDELFTVADAGLLMPPKSTWFEPKLLSGLFIHTLGETYEQQNV